LIFTADGVYLLRDVSTTEASDSMFSAYTMSRDRLPQPVPLLEGSVLRGSGLEEIVIHAEHDELRL
jgi:hypothetical protein